jgi:hypothetical protein
VQAWTTTRSLYVPAAPLNTFPRGVLCQKNGKILWEASSPNRTGTQRIFYFLLPQTAGVHDSFASYHFESEYRALEKLSD